MRKLLFLLPALAILAWLTYSAVGTADNRIPDSESLTIEAAAKALESVVRITTSTGHGSGFYVAEDTIMTAAHVVKDETEVKFATPDAPRSGCKATVKKADKAHDIALLKTTCKGTPLPLTTHFDIGQTILAVGNPSQWDFTVSKGVISGMDGDYIQIDAEVYFGSSGSPVVDLYGYVVGMVVTKDFDMHRVGFAVKGLYLQEAVKYGDF